MKTSAILVTICAGAIGFTAARLVIPGSNADDRTHSEINVSAASVSRRDFTPSSLSAVWSEKATAGQLPLAVAWGDVHDPDEIRKRLDQLRLLPATSAYRAARSALLLNWLQTDPEAACKWCETDEPEAFRDTFSEWVRLDRDAALGYANTLHQANSDLALRAFADVGNSIVDEDPKKAFAFLEELPPNLNISYFSRVLSKLAETNPDELLEFADNQTQDIQESCRRAYAKALAKKDSASALAWWVEQPDRKNLSSRLFGELPSHQWVDAIALYQATMPEKELRLSNFDAYSWVQKDPATLLEIIDSVPEIRNNDKIRYTNRAITAMAKTDPAAALDWYLKQSKPDSAMLQDIAEIWDKADTPAARTALSELGEEGQVALEEALENDSRFFPYPRTATEFSELIADVENGYTSKWLDSLPHQEIEQLPEQLSALNDAQRAEALPGLISALTATVPSTAADLLTMEGVWNEENQNDRAKATAKLTTYWADADPTSAAAWVAELPTGDMRSTAIPNLVRRWKIYDPLAASRWANALSDKASRNAAIATLEE